MVNLVNKASFLEMLRKYFEEQKVPVRIDVVEIQTERGTNITRHDIIRKNEDWFCFSFILHPDGGIGIWTRGHIQIGDGPSAAPVEHDYHPVLSKNWLAVAMQREHILEQLTSS